MTLTVTTVGLLLLLLLLQLDQQVSAYVLRNRRYYDDQQYESRNYATRTRDKYRDLDLVQTSTEVAYEFKGYRLGDDELPMFKHYSGYNKYDSYHGNARNQPDYARTNDYPFYEEDRFYRGGRRHSELKGF